METPVSEIKRVFFAAMMSGYAAHGPKETLPDGSKQYVYRDGDFVVTDRYWVNVGTDFSWGYTLITYQNQPVWQMHYWGWYKPEAIEFLKSVLLSNYSRGIFEGGRGPGRTHTQENGKELRYDSFHYGTPSFASFMGSETIIMDPDPVNKVQAVVTLGQHSFQGGLLFTERPIPAAP